jgi:regulator of protease activity HflC (stomatin/prohibitin superfamily)
MYTTLIFAVVLVFLAGAIIKMGIKIVPQGMEFTVETFGRYVRTLKPGLHLLIPFVNRVGAKINMREQVLDVPQQEVITRDNAMVQVDGVVFYQILDASKAAYEVDDLLLAVLNLTMTTLRTVMGSMDLDQLLSQRDHISVKLLGIIDQATNPWGVKVTRVEIRDITPPRDLVDSMARQMKAERDKRANILEAEGLRQAAILRAEGEKTSAILRAEGEKEAAVRRAEGEKTAAFLESEARERQAEAEAKATAMVSAAIADGDIAAINYFIAQRYVDSLQAIASAPNQKLVLMPLEASGVIGAIGGIAELARDALSDSACSSKAASRRGTPLSST